MSLQKLHQSKRSVPVRRLCILGILAAGVLMLSFIGIPGAAAYFTDRDEAVNTFTVGKVQIEHHEDVWEDLPPEKKQDVTPGQEIPKDPRVENTGENEIFVFQTVQIPCAEVITANADGSKNPSRLTDLFSYKVNSGWTLIGTEDVNEGSKVTAHKYTYVYGTAEKCTRLAEKKSTPTLFDRVTVANLIEGQGLEESPQSILINSYGIQSDNLGEDHTAAPSEVLAIIYNQVK